MRTHSSVAGSRRTSLSGHPAGEPPQSAPPSSRPSEDSLFGGPSEGEQPSGATPTEPTSVNPSAPPAQPPAVEQSGREEIRDEQALSGTTATEAFGSEEHVDDPLKIGGQFYLRAHRRRGTRASSFGNTTFSAPTLVDGYFDARPTDRLRGMVVGRLSFDPTLSAQGTGEPGLPGAVAPLQPARPAGSGLAALRHRATRCSSPLASST